MRRAAALTAVIAAIGSLWVAPTAFGAGGAVGLAFVTETATGPPELMVAAADGSGAVTLGKGNIPLLAPNGKLVATEAIGGGSSLILYSASGTVAGKFFKASQVSANPLAWSRDSRYLAVQLTDVKATTTIGNSGLAIIDTITGKTTTIAHGMAAGASWSPSSDTVAYGLQSSVTLTAPVNLFSAGPTGGGRKQLTHDGHSTTPIWGKRGIAFTHVTNRGTMKAPAYQIYLLSGSHSTQITHSRPGPLVDGLVPIAVSGDGSRLVAEYVGTDTGVGYAIDLVTHSVKQLKVSGQTVTAWGISRDGKRVLVDLGGFENPASAGKVETVPFSGGAATVLAPHGDFPSWNQ